MNNKAQVSYLLALIAIFILVVLLIMALSSDVNFSIKITKSDFDQGEEIVLFYEVENGLIFGDISDITFTYSVINKDGFVVQDDSFSIPDLRNGQRNSSFVTIYTNSFSRGEYRIWAEVEYLKYGYIEGKRLSLYMSIT